MRRTRWTPPRYGACPRSPSNLHWSTTPSAAPYKARCSPPCWLLAAGVLDNSAARLVLRAVDGYTVNISLADAQTCRMIVATHIDNQTMALGGLGPQWAVYDADVLPTFQRKTLKERFALCPWGLYHIDVQKA